MTPVEEFVLNSDKLKTAILQEALAENAQLRERIADLEADLANQRTAHNLVASKMVTLERVNARLMTQLDDMR